MPGSNSYLLDDGEFCRVEKAFRRFGEQLVNRNESTSVLQLTCLHWCILAEYQPLPNIRVVC